MSVRSLEDLIDEQIDALTQREISQVDLERLENLLEHFGHTLLREAQFAMAAAAQKSVEQVATLIRDPAYYEKVKRNRAENRRRTAARKQMEEAERLKEAADPAAQATKQRQRLAHLERNAAWHEGELARCRKEILHLTRVLPSVSETDSKERVQ